MSSEISKKRGGKLAGGGETWRRNQGNYAGGRRGVIAGYEDDSRTERETYWREVGRRKKVECDHKKEVARRRGRGWRVGERKGGVRRREGRENSRMSRRPPEKSNVTPCRDQTGRKSR